MERHKVDAYVCGHDHTLQHLRHVAGHGLDFVVSGAGGAPLYPYIAANELLLMQVGLAQPAARVRTRAALEPLYLYSL